VLLGVLGPLEVRGAVAPGPPRDRVVLSALVVRRGSVVPADVLADALWNELPPRTWPKVVQGSVVRLRKTLGADAVRSVEGGYRLDLPVGQLDLDVFQGRIEQARIHQASGDHARAFIELGDALRLWRGTPLPDALDWPPGRDESQRLDELFQAAEEDRVDTGVAIGRARDLVAEARQLVDEHPERERRWMVLAKALYGAGRQVEALDIIRQGTSRLLDLYGLDPSPDLAELELSMLRQDSWLPRSLATPTASLTCPYPGLLAYGEDDASLFAGRDDDIQACLKRLEHHSVLVVSGASSSGKSSLVHAGLVPALRGLGHEIVVDCTEAPRPGAVLVVDQFEERFPADAPHDASAFLDDAADWADVGQVVLAVRSDHLHTVALSARFAAHATGGIHLVGPLSGESLRRAIEHPARQSGLLLESGLVDVLAADIAGERGGLALLSHALRATWEAGDHNLLTIASYRAAGGVHEALARTAESVWSDLDEEERDAARNLLLRLVTRTGDRPPVAAHLSGRAIAGRSDVEAALDRLVAARLVTTDGDTVTLAHAMLATAWPRLSGWLDDSAGERERIEHLQVSARGWVSSGRPANELYRGQRLSRTLEWRTESRPILDPSETTFLDASAARRSRGHRRLRALLGVIAVAASAVMLTAMHHNGGPIVANREAWLVYTRPDDTGIGTLFVARPDGTDEHPLLSRRVVDSAELHHPDWSPDGARVAFEALSGNPGTPPATVWIADADGSSPTNVAECEHDPCRQFSEPVWSPDGTELAMVRFDLYSDGSCCTSHLETLNLASSARRVVFEVTERAAVTTYDVVYSPTWSPDGTELAFSLYRYETHDPYRFIESQIGIVSALQAKPEQPRFITDPSLNAWHPDWHPTDDRIVFSTQDPDLFPTSARSDIYEVRTDGSGLRQLTDSRRDGFDRYIYPTWAPNGTEIVLSIGRAGSGGGIVRKDPALLPAAGGTPRAIGDLRGVGVRLRPVPDR
jgi:Tol biopolymer transport system component/DNA-binding SARP family transcriptional activator